eukprot:TRINITY_DN4388_c0_g1_i1.p1 TRINITY_DN4388_c0_g1~~TRINITY_DN4388_c0_g1_i1.p1  ORF type:complete len:223 (-),score=41.29 TRINITY_DN4388_c0_g1_i1:350-1018(-)
MKMDLDSLTQGQGFNVRTSMVGLTLSWIEHWDPIFSQEHSVSDVALTIDHLFGIVISLLEQLQCNPKDFFIPVILYSDRFIMQHGIKHNQLFNLLLASTISTAKFWGESVLVSNKRIAKLFNYRLADLNVIERRFLTGIDFRFSLTKTDLENFLNEAIKTTRITLAPLLSENAIVYNTPSQAAENSLTKKSHPIITYNTSTYSNNTMDISSTTQMDTEIFVS